MQETCPCPRRSSPSTESLSWRPAIKSCHFYPVEKSHVEYLCSLGRLCQGAVPPPGRCHGGDGGFVAVAVAAAAAAAAAARVRGELGGGHPPLGKGVLCIRNPDVLIL